MRDARLLTVTWMSGTLVWSGAFWRHDEVSLRDSDA